MFKQTLHIITFILLGLMTFESQAGEVRLDQKLVWSHMVGWNSWAFVNKAYSGHHDVPMARPTGELVNDYRTEIQAMLAAGIDGIAFDLISGPEYLYSCLQLFEAAKGSRLQIASTICVYDNDPVKEAQKIADAYKAIKDFPNYARIDGKPIFFTYYANRYPSEYWLAVRAALAEIHKLEIFLAGDPDPVWNKPTTLADLTKYTGVFDIFYNYAEYGRGGNQPSDETFRITAEAAKTATRTGQWAASVAPGYIGAWPLRGRNNFYIPFHGVDVFWDNWQATLNNGAPWVYLADWNDLDETPLQPMLFQFHTYGELNRYWASRWRGQEIKADSPKIYLAYQREQMLGTLHRIEVVSLPMTGDKPVKVSGQLLDMHGNILAELPKKTFAVDVAARDEWRVDTTAFTGTPVIEPLITVQIGDQITQRRMPMTRLRTGWIQNQVVVKVPVHEMATGSAKLILTDMGNGMLRAVVDVDTPLSVRRAMLWCDDQPIGSLDVRADVLPTYGLNWKWLKDHSAKINLINGSFARSFVHGPDATKLLCDATSMSGYINRYDYFAANIEANSDTVLHISINSGEPQKITLVQLQQGGVELINKDKEAVAVLSLADHDPIASLPRIIKCSKGKLYGQFPMTSPAPSKLFYVRLETSEDLIFYSNSLTPYASETPAVLTTILQTATSLDKGWSGKAPALVDKPINVSVHPALIGQSQWDLANTDNILLDKLGNAPLYLGSAEAEYVSVPKRVPSRLTLPDGTPGLSFDGVDDIAELAIRQQPHGAFTLSMKLRVEKFDGKSQTIFGAQSEANAPLLMLDEKGYLVGGRQSYETDHSILARSSEPLPIGQWCQIVVTFDETQAKLYLNGKQIAQASGSPIRKYGNIRAYLGGPAHSFNGQIADILLSSALFAIQ